MNNADKRRMLAARRVQFVRRVAEQRDQLAQAAAPLALAWQRVERGLQLWRSVRQRLWLVAIPMAALALWRPRVSPRLLAALPALWRAARPGGWMWGRRTP